jgi:hypothetical protein
MPPPTAAAARGKWHGRHHDRPEAQEAGLEDGASAHRVHALGLEREVDHHDRVLLHDADQEHDADDRDDEIGAADEERRGAPTPADGSAQEIVTGCT